MDKAKIYEIRHWLIKAKHNVGPARRLMTGEEPYLDTAVLIGQCAVFDRGFDDLSALADVLTPYVTAFRYPGDIMEPAAPDAEEAIVMAERIVAFVLQRMPDEAKQ